MGFGCGDGGDGDDDDDDDDDVTQACLLPPAKTTVAAGEVSRPMTCNLHAFYRVCMVWLFR